MGEIKIVTEDKKPEQSTSEEVKETLKAADEYQKLKDENDKLEREISRRQEIRAKMMLGGKASAGTTEKNPQDVINEEAAKILKAFQTH